VGRVAEPQPWDVAHDQHPHLNREGTRRFEPSTIGIAISTAEAQAATTTAAAANIAIVTATATAAVFAVAMTMGFSKFARLVRPRHTLKRINTTVGDSTRAHEGTYTRTYARAAANMTKRYSLFGERMHHTHKPVVELCAKN
jgi:hypothetical protein